MLRDGMFDGEDGRLEAAAVETGEGRPSFEFPFEFVDKDHDPVCVGMERASVATYVDESPEVGGVVDSFCVVDRGWSLGQ